MDKLVVICSGLPYSGKSTIMKGLLKQTMFRRATMVLFDKIRIELYGNRSDTDITKAEHLFKNEWARYELLRHLVTGSSTVIMEAVMLTRSGHQRPLVVTIRKAERYLRNIAQERCKRDNVSSSIKIDVNLKVILSYASPEIIEKRAKGNQKGRAAAYSSIFNLSGMWNAYQLYEFPDDTTYYPLYINTSDESKGAAEKRLREIELFIKGKHDPALNGRRREEAIRSFQEMKEKIRLSL